MTIFRPEEVEKVLSGEKTETRRHGIKRWILGSVHDAKTRPSETVAKVMITSEPYQQSLCEIKVENVVREGNYTINDKCKNKFVDKIFAKLACRKCPQKSTCFQFSWIKTNSSWKPDDRLWVIQFKKVEDEIGAN